MAIAEMQKVTIFGAKHLKEQVIQSLATAGIFQPIPPNTGEKDPGLFKSAAIDTAELEEILGTIEPAIDFLERFQRKSSFDLGLFPVRAFISPSNYRAWTKDSKWKDVCTECTHIIETIDELEDTKDSIDEQYRALLPWRTLATSIERLNQSQFTSFRAAIVPSELRQRLIELTADKPYYPMVVEEEGRKSYIIIASLLGDEGGLEDLLQQVRAEKMDLPNDVVPSKQMSLLKTKAQAIEGEKQSLLKRARKLSEERVRLMAVYDHFVHLLREKQVQSDTGLSRYVFTLEGWVKKDDTAVLRNTLNQFVEIEIVAREPSHKDKGKVPIALSNLRIFKPFELVTELYGLPRYVEIDPTPFLAPFFALFLALCLTDGGYGVLMAAIAFILPRRIEVGKSGRKLFSLLFISGLVTIVIGTITGGIFGIHLQQMPQFLAPLKRLALLNPMKEPMTFLLIALAVGVVHLVAGICLKMVDNLKRGRITAAILDQCSWIIIIAGILLTAIPFAGSFFGGQSSSGAVQISFSLSPTAFLEMYNILPAYSQTGVLLTLAGIVVLFLFAGRHSNSVGKRFAKGAYEVYGIIQLFADILSYSRLLALGLATSVIATVVNTIAGMAGEMPYVGPVLLIAILIIGHLGNLLINALSGFIHTARLQFVEFFTKFYQSGGQPFEPLRREGKYTIVRQDAG